MDNPFRVMAHADGHVTFENTSKKTVALQKISFGYQEFLVNHDVGIEIKPGGTVQCILRVEKAKE